MTSFINYCPPEIIIIPCSTNHFFRTFLNPYLFLLLLPFRKLIPIHPIYPFLCSLSIDYEVILSIIKKNSCMLNTILSIRLFGLHNIICKIWVYFIITCVKSPIRRYTISLLYLIRIKISSKQPHKIISTVLSNIVNTTISHIVADITWHCIPIIPGIMKVSA